MLFRLGWAAILLASALGVSADGLADQTTLAPPKDVARLIATAIPDTWKCEQREQCLIVRPRKEPVFVNLMNAEERRANESEDEYIRRHTVRFDYRIALRFGPKLSKDRLRALVEENLQIRGKLQAIKASPLNEAFKGDHPFFPDTKEGQALAQKYEDLERSIRDIPDGYVGNVSVYIEPTFLGFARFLHEGSQKECESVRKRITGLFTPYKK